MQGDKYLLIDKGNVFDGEPAAEEPGGGDLSFSIDTYARILKNGVKIINMLNLLQNEFGYYLAFHSKNKEEDQLKFLKAISLSAISKNLTFPKVCAMAVFDELQFYKISPENAKQFRNKEYDIQLSCYGEELNGKECVRTALSLALGISKDLRRNHIVFDDNKYCYEKAREEGWQAYLIGNGITLYDALYAVLKEEKAKKKFSLAMDSNLYISLDPNKKNLKEILVMRLYSFFGLNVVKDTPPMPCDFLKRYLSLPPNNPFFLFNGKQCLVGFGKAFAVAFFLNDDKFHMYLNYTSEGKENTAMIVKYKSDEQLFEDILLNKEPAGLNFTIKYDQLTKLDKEQFLLTVNLIKNTHDTDIKMIFDDIIQLDKRFQNVLNYLLQRKPSFFTADLKFIQSQLEELCKISLSIEQSTPINAPSLAKVEKLCSIPDVDSVLSFVGYCSSLFTLKQVKIFLDRKINNEIATLLENNIIEEDTQSFFFIHKLTQQAIHTVHQRKNIYDTKSKYDTYTDKMSFWIYKKIHYNEKDMDITHLDMAASLIPHALALCDLLPAKDTNVENNKKARLLHQIGIYQQYCNKNYVQAKECYSKALLIQNLSNELKGKILTNFGNLYGNLGDIKKKIEILEDALKIKEKYFDTSQDVAVTLVNLGNAYGENLQYTKQKEMLDRAVNVYQQLSTKTRYDHAIALISLGTAYDNLKQYKNKITVLLQAQELLKKEIPEVHIIHVKLRENIASAFEKLNNSDKKQLLGQSQINRNKLSFYEIK